MKRHLSSLTLSSDPRNVAKVESYLDNVLNSFGVCQDVYGNILISLTEAVTNAITHGNKNNQEKIVSVKCKCHEANISVQVTDQGEGFDHNTVPDPTSTENLRKPNGRGLFLMTRLSDEIRYKDNGRTVEMRFSLEEASN